MYKHWECCLSLFAREFGDARESAVADETSCIIHGDDREWVCVKWCSFTHKWEASIVYKNGMRFTTPLSDSPEKAAEAMERFISFVNAIDGE